MIEKMIEKNIDRKKCIKGLQTKVFYIYKREGKKGGRKEIIYKTIIKVRKEKKETEKQKKEEGKQFQ